MRKNRHFRHAARTFVYWILSWFGPAFSDRKFSPKLLIKHVLIQKFLRINHHVPWPVHWTSTVKAVQKIEKGNRFPGLSKGCHIDGRNGIKIGDNTWIGPHVCIISMNHDIYDYHQYIHDEPITIGNNCWLGANSVILPGITLGDHVIVAAGAVVTKSFVENDIIIAGTPAKIIKKIQPYKDVQP